MKIRIKVGEKGQIVIPKVIREHMGIKPGDEVIMEVRAKEVIITPRVNPKEIVENFCSVVKNKLAKKINLKKLIEQEAEARSRLH
ncbi:AbrB/MazE/SpoVT family DNA-binding domain-containing protein [Candidatus Bathyarchaeota archaeon]|nr:AbrB/MazE/SpoVT family DNA-binding domain-containing protein [Candidatus Bathyarchaeota archaeon]